MPGAGVKFAAPYSMHAPFCHSLTGSSPMHVQSAISSSLSHNDFIAAVRSQNHAESESPRVADAALPEEDRVTLSAPRVTDMSEEEVQGLLSSTLGLLSGNAGNALAAHSGLDMSRAMRLLDGLDF